MRSLLASLLALPTLACSAASRPDSAPAAPAADGATSAAAASAPSPGAAPAPDVRFPTLVTDDLNGQRQELPHGLPGELKLFVVAYRMEHQRDVDPWITAALRLEQRHAAFRVYELPTLSQRWASAKQWIDDGMRSGIPDRAARARTLTLYLDTEAFNRALALTTQRDIHALLVDADGRVVWRRTGPPDEGTAMALAVEVEARLAARAADAPR